MECYSNLKKNLISKFDPVILKIPGFPGSSVGKESACNAETPVQFMGQKICWRRDRLPTWVSLGFPCDSAGKECACNMGDLGSIPGLERSPGEGKGYPLQYSGLENIVHGVTKSWTRLRDFHFLKVPIRVFFSDI